MSPSRMAFLPARKLFRIILRALIAFVFFPALAGAQQAPVPARITQPIDPTSLTILKGNVHPLARPEFDRGPAPASLQLNRMLLVLKRSPEQEAALESLLDQQQDKSSPNYHQWLTPQQFGQQFGPADQDVQTVVTWLESQGFQVDRVANGRGVIEFSGNAGQVQNAFRTEIHKYAVNGKNYWANASDPQIPSALVPVVAGVASLNSFRRRPMYQLLGIFAKSKKTGEVKRVAAATAGATAPNFTFNCGTDPNTGQPITCYAISPYDFATIYNVLPLWNASSPITGSGQSIAIVARTNINAQDISDFQSLFGLPANPPTVILDGPDPGLVPGDETEADIDVEWSGAVAKSAKINLVVSQSTEASDGVDLSALYIVDNDVAPVMSESYGECELGLGAAGNQFMNNLWEQAAAEGMTVFVSSGDNGAAGCDAYQGTTPEAARYGLEVNGLSSTPYNVAVGGTDFNDFFNGATYWNSTNNSMTQASVKGYVPETTWNDSCTNSLFGQLGFSSSAETNCNNSQLSPFVVTIGGGGGKSACTTPNGGAPSNCSGGYAKPSWQTGTGVPNDSKRDVPDVSLFASNGFLGNFYMLCERDAQNGQACSTSNFLGVGGTSVASPAFAGIMALVEQKTGAAEGNANYTLYKLAAKSGSSCPSAANPAGTCVFYDTPAGSTIAMPCVKGTPNCIVSNSVDQYGVLSGYATTAGYDLATGLGSVNAANLVNVWSTVGSTTSFTTLHVNSDTAVNITHGSSVPVSVSVTPTSPMPTGNVALLAKQNGSSTAFGTLTLGTSGSASGTFSTLPGGTSYSVVAHYGGDATYAGSDSNAVTVTVNPEASKTALSIVTFDPTTGNITNSNATSFTYGSPYLLRSDVTNSSGSTCFNFTTKVVAYPCPTGGVAITDDGSALGPGTFALNSQGYTEYQAIQLTGGSHGLAANYGGDNSYNGSGTTDAVSVTPAATTTSFYVTPTSVLIGSQFSLEAITKTNSSGAVPGGTYTFYEGSAALSGTVNAQGSAGSPTSPAVLYGFGFETASAPSGPQSFTVNYSGDGNYAGSSSSPVKIDVLYPTTMSGSANPSNIIYGTNTTVTLTYVVSTGAVAASAPKPTGTITIQGVTNPVTTTVTQDAQGHWVLQGTTTASIQQSTGFYATYNGDSNYAGGTAAINVTATIPDFSVSTGSAPLVVTAGQTGNETLTITPATNYTSTVSLTCNLAPTGYPAIQGASCTVSPSSVTLTNGSAATATLSLATTGPSSSLTALTAPVQMRQQMANGAPIVWWVFGLVAGLLAFTLSVARRQRLKPAAAGLAVLYCIGLAIGCGGGGTSTSGGGSTGGGPVGTTTTLTAGTTKVAPGASTALTAAVKSSNTVTGTIWFGVIGPPSFQVTDLPVVNGTAQTQLPVSPGTMPIGTYPLVAQYSGDANNIGSQSGTLSVVLTGSTVIQVGGQTGSDFHGVQVNVTLQ